MSFPSVTVVVPTRERADVLQHCLRSLARLDYPNLTILVVDNCSQDNTSEIVQSIGEPRIQYINSGRRLSMSHNWEFALENVGSEWVSIVGDDDSLLPDSISFAIKLANKLGVEAIRGNNCSYYWPGHRSINDFGRLSVPVRTGFETRRSAEWLRKFGYGNCGSYDLPCIYTGGFVKTNVMRDVKKKLGMYFKSRIPDFFSGFAVASIIGEYGFTFRPLGIAGCSKHSNGQSQRLLSNTGIPEDEENRLLPAIEFNSEGEPIPYHPALPTCDAKQIPQTGFALALESYLQTCDLRLENDWCMQDQLAIILSLPEGLPLDDWGKQFAKMHNVSYEKAVSSAKMLRVRHNLRSFSRQLLSAFRSVRVGSSSAPIENVNDACSIAAKILERPPGSLAIFWQSLFISTRLARAKLLRK